MSVAGSSSGGGSSGSPRWVRIFRIGPGSLMNAISRVSQQASRVCSPTACRLAVRPLVAASCRLPMFPFGECRDGGPQLVIWRKDAVVAMPMLPRRRRTRSLSVPGSAWVIGRAGMNAGGASHEGAAAAGTKKLSATHACRCT